MNVGTGIQIPVAITAQQLPPEVGSGVLAAASEAFVDAMTVGFQVSAVILLTAVVIAFTLIPRRMRTEQAAARDEVAVPQVLATEPVPEPAAA